MGSKQALIYGGKLSLKRMIVLICVVFMVSCTLPKPVINQAPMASTEPNSFLYQRAHSDHQDLTRYYGCSYPRSDTPADPHTSSYPREWKFQSERGC